MVRCWRRDILSKLLDVGDGEAQRLDFTQFGVRRDERQTALQRGERLVEQTEALALLPRLVDRRTTLALGGSRQRSRDGRQVATGR